jgi:hypothetical protein
MIKIINLIAIALLAWRVANIINLSFKIIKNIFYTKSNPKIIQTNLEENNRKYQ